MSYTITYDEDIKGFTSFHSFIPDWMNKLNNRFFTVKDGQLYLHNDENNSVRNNFYGVQYPTTVTYIINEAPSTIKVAKTLNLESNKPFSAIIRSYLNDETTSITESTINLSEFVNKEGKWYGYIRRNELTGDYTAKNAYGLGRVLTSIGNDITLTTPISSSSIGVGDTLLDELGNTLGVIQTYVGSVITLDTTPVIAANTFVLGYKNARVEGSEIRGYNFEVTLTDNSTSRTELFAASSEMFKSEPS